MRHARLSLERFLLLGAFATTFGLAAPAAASPSGVQKGLVKEIQTVATFDPHEMFCGVEISWALWTLLGEPVEDYLVKLTPCRGEWRLTRTRKVTPSALERSSPDLYRSLRDTAPLELVVRTKVEFRNANKKPIAIGTLDITPDLIEPVGRPQTLSVPGSPEWDHWFVDIESAPSWSTLAEPWSVDDSLGEKVKKAWSAATTVEIVSAQVIYVVWPETPFLGAAVELSRKTSDVTASDFWSAGESSRDAISEELVSTARSPASQYIDSNRVSRSALGARQAKVKERLRPKTADGTSGTAFGLRVPAELGGTVKVDGTTVSVRDGLLPLEKGGHSVVLEVPGGRYVGTVECAETERRIAPRCVERREEPEEDADSDDEEAGGSRQRVTRLLLLPYCDEAGVTYHTVLQRACSSPEWTFERIR